MLVPIFKVKSFSPLKTNKLFSENVIDFTTNWTEVPGLPTFCVDFTRGDQNNRNKGKKK